MDEAVKNQIIDLIAKKFIQRPSPPAMQFTGGGYKPLRDKSSGLSDRFSRTHLSHHLDKTETYGHYLIDDQDRCKLFVFDIDLAPEGYLPTVAMGDDPTEADYEQWLQSFRYVPDLRAAWHDRRLAVGRAYIKKQMRELAGLFAGAVHHVTDLPTATAYSGNKGLHVYGFTGTGPAALARSIAEIVLNSLGNWEQFRGTNFWRDSRFPNIWTPGNPRPARPETPQLATKSFDEFSYFNFHVEVFPKQVSLEGKDLGNLVRLPLGVNLHHPTDPTFFIDLTSPLGILRPVDPLHALTAQNPFSDVPVLAM